MRRRRNGHRDDRRGPLSGDDTPESVSISASALAAACAHASREAPNECCGLLVGTPGIIDEAVAIRNVLNSPTRYQIDPAEHIVLNRRLRGSGRSIVGAYHSHPLTAAVPSPRDIAEAHYPEFVWLIVSLLGELPECRAFRISEGRVMELRISS
ncbi:MAG TPA: M67 family metallopeptidase [Vicinamibacterales bacterium]|nr:M67 family metallopeptidase [Vicinamibacterales bacterium]